MTRVDFYVVEHGNPRAHDIFVCRLAERAWREGHKIHIRCDSETRAADIDDLMWSYKDTSFLPHALVAGSTSDAPVTIDHTAQTPPSHDVLINLGPDVPDYFSRFDRVMETAGNDDSARAAARERYRYYQERGYKLHTHKMDARDGR